MFNFYSNSFSSSSYSDGGGKLFGFVMKLIVLSVMLYYKQLLKFSIGLQPPSTIIESFLI